jgi:23S rRNA (cytidine1920-2'-O)/16S rRNA (cytidine1409-2'-O)-methyltransferase
VLVAGAPADKASRLVAESEPVRLLGAGPRFVGRGGEKLDAALRRFPVPVHGRTALDIGSSTGGFTDCLLQHGALRVYAVDVGRGQLHPRLRADPRVTVLERTNARALTPALLGRPGDPFGGADLVTVDVSFISLTTVLPALVPLTRDGADLVLLVKPQFEAGRREASKGRGVIRDPAVWRRALLDVASALERSRTGIMGAMASPLTGPAGNTEFLLHAAVGRPSAEAVADLMDSAVAEAGARTAG